MHFKSNSHPFVFGTLTKLAPLNSEVHVAKAHLEKQAELEKYVEDLTNSEYR